MPSNPHHEDYFRRPEVFLANLLKKGIQGGYRETDENVPVLFRAVVVAVDVQGGKLQNPSASGKLTHLTDGKEHDISATVGVENPQNSIKARIITEGFDQFVGDAGLRIFWPFFPEHISVPIKPGEHVYVMFEDRAFLHGLWISKVPGHADVNFFKGDSSFKSNESDSLSEKFSDTKSLSTEGEKFDSDQAASETRPDDGRLTDLF